MKEETVGMTTKKSDFSEWYLEAVRKAGVVDQRYPVKGFPVYLPNGMFAIREITRMLEQELEKKGHDVYAFPVVIPEENLNREKEHVKGFEKEVFWITHAGIEKLERRLFLRPTSETAIYPMFSIWIKSYRDLPLRTYQAGQVYRYETKMTKPLIRGREFFWIETHTAHKDWASAEAQVRDDLETAKTVLHKLGINFIALQRPDWDKFPGAEYTYAYDTVLPDGKVLQIATTHHLGEKFAKAFNIQYEDEDEQKHYANQTCFGPGVSRFLAASIALHGDDKGLALPSTIARIQVAIIPILKKGMESEIMDYAREIGRKLAAMGIRYLLDDRDYTPGYKFNDHELKGVPLRIEVGGKEASSLMITVVNRLGKRYQLKLGELQKIRDLLDEYDNQLRKSSDDFFHSMISEAHSIEELKSKTGLVKIGLCSLSEGEACAEKIKQETGFEIRGKPIGSDEKATCIVCGKPGVAVYAGRPY